MDSQYDLINMSDADLRKELLSLGVNCGPVCFTTRDTYIKKLLKLRNHTLKPETCLFDDIIEEETEPILFDTIPEEETEPLIIQEKGKPFASFLTPMKNTGEFSDSPTTPLSAKSKTVSQFNFDNNSSSEKKKEWNLQMTQKWLIDKEPQSSVMFASRDSSPRPLTPKPAVTPLRSGPPSASRRTPLRFSQNNSPMSRGNVFCPKEQAIDAASLPPKPAVVASSTTPVFEKKVEQISFNAEQNAPDDSFTDDHTETLRILSSNTIEQRWRSSSVGHSSYKSLATSSQISNFDPPVLRSRHSSIGGWRSFNRLNNEAKYYAENNQNESFDFFSYFGLASDCGLSVWISLLFVCVLIIAYFWTTRYEINFNFVYQIFSFLHSRNVFRIIIGFVVITFHYVLYRLYKYWKPKKKRHNVKLMPLVSRVIDAIRIYGADNSIPEAYLRNIFMHPIEHTSEEISLWAEVVKFINEEEPRVRTEYRIIDGKKCKVWQWDPDA